MALLNPEDIFYSESVNKRNKQLVEDVERSSQQVGQLVKYPSSMKTMKRAAEEV